MSALVLAAPLAGWATGLDEVPDPAFAEGLVGDGVAIDPTSSELCAPCDGVVVSVHRAHHACTLRADDGAEVLLHIGVDTVDLQGEGFRVLVERGRRVRTGDPLIGFDMDLIARRARSLHTAILLVNGDGHAVVERVKDREVAVGDMLLAIARRGDRDPTASAAAASASGMAERRAQLLLPHGLHARPAAAFARRARQHAGTVTVVCGPRSADGKSMVSLMALDARCGDDLAIVATGPSSQAAVATLTALVVGGPGDRLASRPARDAADDDEAKADADRFGPGEEILLVGSPAAGGLAVGQAVRLDQHDSTVAPARDGAGIAVEQERLATALADLAREIEQTIAGAGARGDAAARDIFRAHLDLLDDPALVEAAGREIAAGRSAAWAWRVALRQVAAVLRGLGNPRLAERTGDLDDLERRMLARLAGRRAGRLPDELPARAVLIADELLPSELAAVPAGRLAALCTARGGPTSHVAILAAGMGVPAVVAIGSAVLRVPDGAPILVDGDRGEVRVFPATATRQAARDHLAARAVRRRTDLAAAHQPGVTADGVAVAVCANLGHAADAAAALEHGADGCGLLRTELLFLDRLTASGEDEQLARYQEIADALEGRPLVIRTLDAGGDKPLAYLPSVREDNPALGVRGVRLSLRHPDLLRAQIRAILRVVPAGVCRILVPMIAAVSELRAVRAIVDQERRALGVSRPIQLGAMIEVPVAALLAEQLAGEADFFSIGTNDLAQYALAMDRANPHVAGELDSLHPGVLRLISSTVAGARTRGRPVAVCGGAAADACAAPILVGLGVRALSIAPAVIPELKAFLRTVTASRCAEVAGRALELDSSAAVRALVMSTWPGMAAHHE